MTVIAWDGKRLAADKLGDMGGMKITVTKIFRLKDGSLAGFAGNFATVGEMLHWLNEGEIPDLLPASQRDENMWVGVLRIMPDKRILKYERSPYPMAIENHFTAIGCGREFAIGAMSMGASAHEAVNIANHNAVGCGQGIDILELENGS